MEKLECQSWENTLGLLFVLLTCALAALLSVFLYTWIRREFVRLFLKMAENADFVEGLLEQSINFEGSAVSRLVI